MEIMGQSKDENVEARSASSDLQNLIRSTDLATIFVNRELNIKLYTPRAEVIFNLNPSDVGRPLSDITHKLEYPELQQDVEGVLSDTHVEREVVSLVGAWYVARLIPYRAADDRPDGVILTFVDINERKRAEEELRESEEWLRAIFNASRDGILAEDKGVAVYVNDSYARMLGYDHAGELLGRHISDLSSHDDAERMTEYGQARLRGESRPTVYTFKGQRKDGSLIDVEAAVSVAPIGDKKYVITALRDITARLRGEEKIRESEESYRRLVELSPDTVIVVSEGQIKYINTAGLKLFGASNAEQIINKRVLDLIHPDFQNIVEVRIKQTLTGQQVGLMEEKFVRLDGQVVDVDVTAVGVRYLGTPSTQAIVRNIGERVRLKEARLQLLRRLSEAQEDERRRIAREMHDQFGQQLTALTIKLGKLVEECGPTNLGAQIGALKGIAEQLAQDVDYLAWEMRPAALDEFGLQTALSSYVENWSKHFGVPIELHVSGMDRDRLTPETETALYRIAQEALNNVAKHAQATSVAVVLDRHSDNVSLIIEDDGVGFDWQQIFSEVDKGLGLVGMRERAELIGGAIEIESQSNKGTTLFVRIPVSRTSLTGRDG